MMWPKWVCAMFRCSRHVDRPSIDAGFRQDLARRARSLLVFLCAGAALCLTAGGAGAQDTDWKTGKLGHLAVHIGTYHYSAVLDDPGVRQALQVLAGDDVPTLITNLDVASPIAFIDSFLVLRGNAPHRGGEEEALVMVRIFDGKVIAGLLHGGRATVYAGYDDYAYIPGVMRDFVRPRPAPYKPETLPPGVTWLGRGGGG